MRWRDNGWSIGSENIWADDVNVRLYAIGGVSKPPPMAFTFAYSTIIEDRYQEGVPRFPHSVI